MRTTRAKTPKGILKAAARLIRERGWCQFRFQDDAGRIDISHAINTQTRKMELRLEAYDLAMKRIGPTDVIGLPSWNDQPERTVEDILKVLEGGPS